MEHVISELREVIELYSIKINAFSEEELSLKPSATKWSKKEILGHLIDSAQNNLRRFICSQYEGVPPKITYNQDFWVVANNYNQLKKEDVILMWKLTNFSIINILSNMPRENYSLESDTGKHSIELHSLSYLAEDYVKHAKHHINQIIPGSFNITYP